MLNLSRGIQSRNENPYQDTKYLSFPIVQGQNPWLDILRVTAISLVLLRHGERSYLQFLDPDHSGSDFISRLLLNGWVGVDLFLVLSGYLIGYGLLRRFNSETFKWWPYIRDRILRIVPAYYAVLFAVVLGVFPGYQVSDEQLGFRIAYHLLFLQDYLTADINIVFWSLGVEEKFYLLAPILFAILLRMPTVSITMVLLTGLWLLSPVYKFLIFQNWDGDIDYRTFFENFRSPFHATLEPLVVGIAVSYITVVTKVEMKIKTAGVVLAVCGIVATLWLGSHNWMSIIDKTDASIQPAMVSLLAGIAVWAAIQLAKFRPIGEPFWRTISRLSYALYLVHFPLLPLAHGFTRALDIGYLGFWIVYIGLSFYAALLLHFAVEKPFLLLKAKFKDTSVRSDQIRN